MNLELKKFNPRNIDFRRSESLHRSIGPVIILQGRRSSGKSVLVRDLLYHHQDIPVGTVISGTEEGNGFYGPLIPKCLIHYEYTTTIIENILKRQKLMIKKIESDIKTYGTTNVDPRQFVIMDDCLYDDKWTRDVMMRCLFMNGRHWRVFLIITMQTPLGIPPALRGQIDYVFILRNNIIKERQKIYDNYAGMFPTFEAFNQIMNQCTENYECLVITNNTRSNKLEDQVFWYKANDNHPQFRLGSEEYWEISRQMGDDVDGSTYNPNSFKKRAAGPTINVKKATR